MSYSPSNKTKSDSEAHKSTLVNNPKTEETAEIPPPMCSRRNNRKRAVSDDFEETPCDCCPSSPSSSSTMTDTTERSTKKRKMQKQDSPSNISTAEFVREFQSLAGFLKGERSVLQSGSSQEMVDFYQPCEKDTDLVHEWRSSGHQVYASMREKLQRLEQMEAKFGTWEEHFGTSKKEETSSTTTSTD